LTRKSLPRNLEDFQTAENRNFVHQLTLTCPLLASGIFASSQTVDSVKAICLHEEYQWWKTDIQNCAVHELSGVIQELTNVVHFVLGRMPENKKGL
jgi:hypothetical protein